MKIAIAAALFTTFVLSGAPRVEAAIFDWEASSGLLPNQISPEMVLSDSSTQFDPALSGGIMTLHTSTNTESMNFLQSTNLNIPAALEIDATMRYVSGSSVAQSRSPATIFIDTANNVGTAVIIGPGYVASVDQNIRQSAAVDTSSAFHDYRILFAGTSFTVYQDSVPLFTDTVYTDPNQTPAIGFGDGSSGASGISEWKSFSHNAAVVPEPKMAGLLGVGVLLLQLFGRRRQRAGA